MPITSSYRKHGPKTRRLHISITEAEIEKLSRFRDRVADANPRLRPSLSLIIAEAISALVDDRPPLWSKL